MRADEVSVRKHERRPMHKKLWLSVVSLTIGASLLVAAGFAGAASSGTQKAERVGAKTGGTLRVNLSDTDFDYLDPALSYSAWTWQFTYLTNLKLLNFPDKSGQEGARIIPEGAAA